MIYYNILYYQDILLYCNYTSDVNRSELWEPSPGRPPWHECFAMACGEAYAANLRAETPDFGGLDSSILLILRVGILRSIGDVPEIVSQQVFILRNLSMETGRTRQQR